MIVASRGSDQFPLRLPEGMREQIKAVAAENGRSMNSEIVFQLKRAMSNLQQVSEECALSREKESNAS